MNLLRNRISDLLVTRFLRMGKNATLKVTNADGTESDVDLTELGVLDGLTSTAAELNKLDGATVSTAEINTLDGVTAGTVVASKAVVADANKDLGDFRNLDCVNLDAGASGTAGTVDVFPATASKGKFILSCIDQDADTTVTLSAAAMGQASVVSIPDPGAATANVLLTDAGNDGVVVNATAAELNAATDVSARLVDIGDNTTYTALVANSGKPHVIPDLTGGLTITLPTPAAGLEYEFTYYGVAADAQNWIIDSGSDTNYFVGGLAHLDTDAGSGGDEIVPIAGNGSSNSKLTVVTPDVGTRVKLVCTGTLWILSGYAVSATVPSFADQ